MNTVRHNWQRLTLLDFNNWLKEKAEGHEKLRILNSKAKKNEEPVKPKTTKVFAANSQVTSKAQDKSKFPPCVLCKSSHALWNCAVFKEKNATQRAKYVAEQKICFACLNGNQSFRQCSRSKKCPKPECDSTHNVLLHKAERIFPRKENSKVSNKPGKVRRVLNGASKFHGTSLNKSLLVGPDLLQNLILVLLQFRQHKYAVSADIEGMFLQVGALARDQISLRFLWREDTTSDLVVHQYTRHIFGARDLPTCANFALRKTATDTMSTYPEAASVVNEKFYMDDYLDSFENVTHAIKISRNLVSLLKMGGFNLTKFVSNADEITSAMNPEESETSSSPIKEIYNGAEQSSHVIGLKWDHVKDTLVVSRGVDRPLDKAITQRTVLSFVSSVFDPVWLVVPYTVRARLLLKDIWKISGQSWDDELPEDIRDKFLEWHSGLPLLGQLTIPRCYFTDLHIKLSSTCSVIARRTFSVRLDFCVSDSRARTKLKYRSSLVKLSLRP